MRVQVRLQVRVQVRLRQFWSHSHPRTGFTVLGSEVPEHRLSGCHPSRSCRAFQAKGTPRWGSELPKHGGHCSHRALHGAAPPAQPLPCPESNGVFGVLSWAQSPPLQHSLCQPLLMSIPSCFPPASFSWDWHVPGLAAACHCHRLQLELASPLSRSGGALGFSLCSPQAPLSHHHAPFISKKTVFS